MSSATTSPPTVGAVEKAVKAIGELKGLGLRPLDHHSLVTDFIQQVFSLHTIPQFLATLAEIDTSQPELIANGLNSALSGIQATSQAFEGLIPTLPAEIRQHVLSYLESQRRVVLLRNPQEWDRQLFAFVWHSLSHYCKLKTDSADNEDAMDTETDNTADASSSMSASFEAFCARIRKLRIVSSCERVIIEALFRFIEMRLKTAEEDFAVGLLETSRTWLKGVAFQWLDLVFGSESIYTASLEQWKSKAEYFLFETLGTLRMNQLFDIIVDFPESEPALEDLRESLRKTRQFSQLLIALKSSFQKRLLHPGASTLQILTVYVSTIQALRFLDPSGVLLDKATPEVRHYLRRRNDTLRVIVSAFTDESSPLSSLFEELSNSDNPSAQSAFGEDDDEDSEDEDDESYQKWNPKPVAAQPDGELSLHKPPDTITMLVQVYGSRELFAKEYTAMLADRLLSMTDFNTEREVRNVELLKLKFGEANLQNCEIMLKDMADSKRINTYVRGEILGGPEARRPAEEFPFAATLVSYLYWPNQFKPDDEVCLPRSIKKQAEQFTSKYVAHKASRKIEWQHKIGVVELELNLECKTVAFTVSPSYAAVITLFEQKDKWSIEEACAELQVSPETVESRFQFWVRHGVIRDLGGGSFEIVEQLGDGGPSNEVEEADALGEVVEESDESYDPFVLAMLTNLGTMPLARIHQMLCGVVPGYDERTIQQTNTLLARLVQQEKIELNSNEYTLKK